MQGSKRLKLINGRKNGTGDVMKYRTATQLPVLSCQEWQFTFPTADHHGFLAMKDLKRKQRAKELLGK